MAEVSITKLFIGGIVPGPVLASLFMGYTIVWALAHPGSIPAPDLPMSFIQKPSASLHLIPVMLLIALVLGSIYAGIATATEAAALGVVGALAIAAAQGSMSAKVFGESFMGGVRL